MPRPKKLDLNCIPVSHSGDDVLVPLPRALWIMAGICCCEHCNGSMAYFDTLSVPRFGETMLVHEPALQPKAALGHVRRAYHLAKPLVRR